MLLFALLILMISCHRNSPFQGKGISSLQGTWAEDTLGTKTGDDNNVYTRYSFRFTCDSVYIIMKTHAGQDYFATPCYAGGKYTEYVKGTYIIQRDSLVVSGVFTHPNLKMKVAGCYRSGNIRFWYKIIEHTPATLNLRNSDEHGPVNLKHTQTCVCVPRRIGD